MTNEINSLLQALRLRLQETDYKTAIPLAYQLRKAISLQYRLHMGGDMVPCQQCGQEFIRGHDGALQIYCSEKCVVGARLRSLREATMARRIGRTCAHCGQAIPMERNNSAKFCSAKCRYTAKNLQRASVPKARTGGAVQ